MSTRESLAVQREMRKRSKHIGASKSVAWWEPGPMWPHGLGTEGYTFNSLFTFHRRCVLKIILLSVAYFLLLIKTKTLWFEHCSKATACVWFLTNSKWFPNLSSSCWWVMLRLGHAAQGQAGVATLLPIAIVLNVLTTDKSLVGVWYSL